MASMEPVVLWQRGTASIRRTNFGTGEETAIVRLLVRSANRNLMVQLDLSTFG
jgi:hypothetical protein